MFAGHDTSTSTLTFMMHELARHPDVVAKLCEEQDRVLGGATPDIDRLEREMPYLDMVLDEVLRLYPPAWIGPRRAVRDFEFGGHRVSRGAYVNYCSWASHRIPEVFPEPEAFIPERFTRERKAALPRGAYVPFGGGRRICIGKRFGQIEVKLVATMLLQRLRLDAMPGRTMTVRQMPTLSPRGGLQMRVLPRAVVSRRSDAGAGHLRHPLRRLDGAGPAARGVLPRAAGAAAGGHRRADLPRRPLRLPLRLGRRRGRCFRRPAAPDRRAAWPASGSSSSPATTTTTSFTATRENRLEAQLAAGRSPPDRRRAARVRLPRPRLLPLLPRSAPARGRGRDRLPDLQLRRRALHPRPLPRPPRPARAARAATGC